ncbi:hypothetical protein ABDB91_10630 [Desulfoscipio sp. XC116]|uniref:PilN domain-containing protein n=1 Tax=Desulfoscipio sp. XC116 TaxID=3144975 RepID=UPI00325BE01F
MYIKINLLPPEIKARWEQERKKRAALITAVAVLAIFIVLYGVLLLATLQVRAGASRLQQERAELESKFPALRQYARLQNQVKEAEGLINEAVGITPEWASVLKNIGLYIPVNVWLTDLSFTKEEDKPKTGSNTDSNTTNNQTSANNLPDDVQELAQTIQGLQGDDNQPRSAAETCGELIIRGYAFEYAAVTSWLEQIRRIPELINVNCRFSSREDLNGEPVIRFEIKAGVLAGQPAG